MKNNYLIKIERKIKNQMWTILKNSLYKKEKEKKGPYIKIDYESLYCFKKSP